MSRMSLQPTLSEDISATFWQVWLQEQDYLYRCCLKWMGGNPTEAEDARSQAMEKALEKLREGAVVIKNFKAWLTQLTHNLCMDIHRKRKRRAIEVESFEAIASTCEEEWVSQEETPVLAAYRRELELSLRNSINNLPPRLRETFILYWEKEESYQDIAQQLNISYDNVRKRISQARAILRQQLNEYKGEESSALAPSRKRRPSIKTDTLAQFGAQEPLLTAASDSPKKRALSIEPIQPPRHQAQPRHEKTEALPEISLDVNFEPMEPVLVEAQSDEKLEEIEVARWEEEADLLVGQAARARLAFVKTFSVVQAYRPLWVKSLDGSKPRTTKLRCDRQYPVPILSLFNVTLRQLVSCSSFNKVRSQSHFILAPGQSLQRKPRFRKRLTARGR